MNEVQVHEMALKSDAVFDKLDQDQNHLISQTELQDFIAKNPTDIDTVTAAKFMLDNFKLISNLENYKEDHGNQIFGDGIGHDDLNTLKQLTEADGDGVQRLVSDREITKALWGTVAGSITAGALTGFAAASDFLPEFLEAGPVGVGIAGVLIVGGAVGAGIGYEIAKHEETNKYTQEQNDISALYTK